ncbi:MAG: hypothetical protein M5U22_04410 [Thermoleophilia bacterium]|nr:hypothetical protein [Thermoleophilia bacterium]
MKTTEAMTRLARANPVDARALAQEGRSPGAQAALDRIFAAATDPTVGAARGGGDTSSLKRSLLVLATLGLVAAAVMLYQLPLETPRSGQTSTPVAETVQQGPVDPEDLSVAGLPSPSDSSGDASFLSPHPTMTPLAPQTYAFPVPGSTHLLTQVEKADIVVLGTITEVSPTPSSGADDPGYTTFLVEPAEILLERAGSTPAVELPATGEGAPVKERLVFRALGPEVEGIGHRGGLAVGDQVVFIGTRHYPLGASSLPGFWLPLGDFSAYREQGGRFRRVAPAHEDPMGDSFTLPELREILAPYGR